MRKEMKEGPHGLGCQEEEELRVNMPNVRAGTIHTARRTAFCVWTVRSVLDTLVWETRRSLGDDAPRQGVTGTVLVYTVAPP